MKKILFPLFIITTSALTAHAQSSILPAGANTTQSKGFIYGIRAGLNIANVSNHSALGASHKFGFMLGAYADNSYGKLFGMRQEITYSRQGFHFRNEGSSGIVDLRYILAANLFTLNLGHILQGHLGPQVGYLANATADTVRNLNSSNVQDFFSIKGQTRRLNYGGCAGIEVYPYKGLLVGVRYNLSFTPVNKRETNLTYARARYNNDNPNYYDQDVKTGNYRNAVWQVVIGWRFGQGINARKKG